jgi:hypothetical protein
VYFGIFLVESLQLGHIVILFLVNVSENLQFFFLLNGYSIFYFALLRS